MQKTFLAAVIGAAIVASLAVMVSPSSNEANAQAQPSKAWAKCILDNLENSHSDHAAKILAIACNKLHP